jgi:hypothetical protein
MGHDFVYWALMIATGLAFTAVIAALIFLYTKATTSKSGDK